ncbi:MAG: 4a-hydroxytetrahydrobiopterin dehydratase [Phycisphaeraceae bacterium]|nr:4a-hydroxytetrahydrobiopterin dehydratase [Phycisphaeraceae bacterium]
MATTQDQLKQQSCVPCQGNMEPLQGPELQKCVQKLTQGWKLIEDHHLEKTFHFPDFVQALDFVNSVGALAESENHHPDITLTYCKVTLALWTHKIRGLHENDFILAAKIDSLVP